MENKMEKRYGLPTAIAMGIGIVIGSGVFIKGGKVLSLTGGNMAQAVLVVGVVGLICIICSLVFAELGSKYEKVNGLVDYAEVALGSKYAYYVGWFMTTIYTPTLSAMLAFFSSMMCCSLFGIQAFNFATGAVSAEAIGLGAAFLIFGYGINAISPKLAGKLQVSMTVIKLIPLIIMGIVGTIAGLANGSTQAVLDYVNTAAYTPVAGGFFNAIVAFAFAYEGWILATSINAELKDAKRNLPIALISGALVCIVIYALYIFAMSSVGDVNTIIGTWPLGETLPKIAFSKLFGNVVGTLVYVFITISCLGTMNGLIMSSCRSLYSISCRGLGPNPKFFGDLDHQNNFAIKSSLFGMMAAGFWYAWQSILWMQGPDLFGGLHNIQWIAWEPDEIGIVCLYLMYIPMMVGLMRKATDFGPIKRYVLPSLGLLCCVFMVYCCWVGKGMQQCVGFLIFFAIVMAVGRIFYHAPAKEKEKVTE